MPYEGSKTKEVLIHSLMIATIVAIPFLTALAYRGWAKRGRQDLPHWRSSLGMASIVLTFVSWLILGGLALSVRIGINTSLFPPYWMAPIALLVFVGTCLGFAWRGTSRIEAIVAGLLMVTAWLMSVVS
jgi:hypothetical protein